MALSRTILIRTGIATLVATLVLSGSLPTADPHVYSAATAADLDPLDIDAQSLARSSGESFATAAARLHQQQAGNTLLEKLRVAAGERYAGGWLAKTGTAQLYLRLTGAQHAPIVDQLIAASDLRVNTTYGAASSLDQRVHFADSTVFNNWVSKQSNIQGSSVDEMTDSIVMDTLATTEIPAEVLSAARAAGVEIKQRIVKERAGDTNRGGRNMSGCTSGFVFSNGGPNQLVLAAHCSYQDYYFFNGDGPFATSCTGQVYNQTADLQWRQPVSHTAQGTFYADITTGDGRNQAGQSFGSLNSYVCRRGMSSGYDCGHIDSTTYKPLWSGACPGGACNSTFARVDIGTVGGDSGGPWFSGNFAYGIQKGGSTLYAVYSKLGYLPAGLNIVVP